MDWSFQFTRPGGRDFGPDYLYPFLLVSIHAPGWARLDRIARVILLTHVSIHAPGWARPKRPVARQDRLGVSIHAPGWARPSVQRGTLGHMLSFNSRARVGATPAALLSKSAGTSFNSRARVGATGSSRAIGPFRTRFNSRARVGATNEQVLEINKQMFQFTRPGGRDSS